MAEMVDEQIGKTMSEMVDEQIGKTMNLPGRRVELLSMKVASVPKNATNVVPGTSTISLKHSVRHLEGQKLTKRQAEMVDEQTEDEQTEDEQTAEREAEYHRGWRVGHDEGLRDGIQCRKPDATVPEGCDDGLGENVVGLSMGWCHGYDAGYTEGLEIGLRARIGIDEDGDVIDEDE